MYQARREPCEIASCKLWLTNPPDRFDDLSDAHTAFAPMPLDPSFLVRNLTVSKMSLL